MAYECRIIKDSISPDGVRLTTFEATFPRLILAEVNTHRMLSRNSASSRAIPVKERIKMILEDPYIPEQFGKNQRGMQAGEDLGERASQHAREHWLVAMHAAVEQASNLAALEVHKQLANRLLEPFAWHTAVITATEWENFFNQRCHPNAQPEFQKIAGMMRGLLQYSDGSGSGPRPVDYGQWHLPYVDEDEAFDLEVGGDSGDAVKVSTARCARVSYLTQDGVRSTSKDLELYERLAKNGHMSPLEHVARPLNPQDNRDLARSKVPWTELPTVHPIGRHFVGNFAGWVQHRKEIPGEDVFRG